MQRLSRLANLFRCSWIPSASCSFAMSRLQWQCRQNSASLMPLSWLTGQYGITQISSRRLSSQAQNDEFSVCKFGDLVVETGSLCDIHVKPVNPQFCPDQNRASLDGCDDIHVDCSTANGFSHLKVTKKAEAAKRVKSKECVLEVPIKFNVNVTVAGDKNVAVGSMQNESLHVIVETGDCTLTDIHTNRMVVTTDGGNIVSNGVQHGDAKLRTCLNGHVRLNKPLCQLLDIVTEYGDVTIESLYADESTIATHRGNIEICSAHRSIDINSLETGSVNIESLDGNLKARVKNGNVAVYACQHNIIDISVHTGDITLKVPGEKLLSTVNLRGRTVSVDEQLDQTQLSCTETPDCQHLAGLLKQGNHGDTTPASITAHTSCGNITVICQDWITSLKLKHKFLDSDDD